VGQQWYSECSSIPSSATKVEVMMIDGLVLKGDHSRKAAKLIKIKGVRLFKSIYTLMNGDGQVMSL